MNTAAAYPVQVVQDTGPDVFIDEKRSEPLQLLEKGTYKIVPRSSIPPGAVFLGSRFVLAIKEPESDNPRRKARFVILGHHDPDKGRIVNEAPTVTRASIRLILALSRMFNYDIWTRDVTQAFVQSRDNLNREVYVTPPKGQDVLLTLDVPPDLVLKAVRPLYGLIEAPNYWWCTFFEFHSVDLNLLQSVIDPCLFYKIVTSLTNNGQDQFTTTFDGAQAVFVDDTIGTGTVSFQKLEATMEITFETKLKQSLPFKFNGFHYALQQLHDDGSDAITAEQHQNGSTIQNLHRDHSIDVFAKIRGMIAYIASSTRPDAYFYAAKLAKVSLKTISAKAVALMKNAVDILG